MNTKHKGDIAEQAAVLEGLKRGWGVLRPIGDNQPYDLIFDISGRLIKVQVKCAWFDEPSQNYVVDNRRTKTNRRVMIRDEYNAADFDFALVYLPDFNLFYVFPVNVFIATAVKFTWSKLISVNENQSQVGIVMLGVYSYNGLRMRKLIRDHLPNSGKPVIW